MTSDPTCAEDVYMVLKYRIVVDRYGTRRYYNSAGQRHRVEGPAVELTNGDKFWYQNDLFHRTDGPAVELSNGVRLWRLHGVEYTESEYYKELERNNDH